MASGVCTHAYTHVHTFADESDFKKPGVGRGRHTPGLKIEDLGIDPSTP